MKKYILILIVIGFGIVSCESPNKKEITEVESLLKRALESEKSLLSLDTARVFATNRMMKEDFASLNKFTDTLKKEEAFRIADIFGSKKKFVRLNSNYSNFLSQLEITKTQLNNLKRDLENDLIKKEQYLEYYNSENNVLIDLISKVNKYSNGIETAIGKYELERPELLEILNKRKLRAEENE